MTSSTKPEVHNLLKRRHRKTEPRRQERDKNLVNFGRVVPEICVRTDRQTDRQTDRLITILRTPTGAE